METKKSKALRAWSRVIGYVGVIICLALIGLEVYGLMMLDGSLTVQVPFVENTQVVFMFDWKQVYVMAAVAALIIVLAVILRVAAKKAKAAPVAATKGDKARELVANAKAKALKAVDTVKTKAQDAIDFDEAKEKVTAVVKENAPVIIAVLATFIVTTTVDRIVMHKKIKKLRARR